MDSSTSADSVPPNDPPKAVLVEVSSVSPPEQAEQVAPKPTGYMKQKLYDTGVRIFYCMEYIGEIVANIMGLNESKYQYVLDSMDENDWKIAHENNEKRIAEQKLRAAGGSNV